METTGSSRRIRRTRRTRRTMDHFHSVFIARMLDQLRDGVRPVTRIGLSHYPCGVCRKAFNALSTHLRRSLNLSYRHGVDVAKAPYHMCVISIRCQSGRSRGACLSPSVPDIVDSTPRKVVQSCYVRLRVAKCTHRTGLLALRPRAQAPMHYTRMESLKVPPSLGYSIPWTSSHFRALEFGPFWWITKYVQQPDRRLSRLSH
jgi:hypothetical protein